jgi:hypothetical protein
MEDTKEWLSVLCILCAFVVIFDTPAFPATASIVFLCVLCAFVVMSDTGESA